MQEKLQEILEAMIAAQAYDEEGAHGAADKLLRQTVELLCARHKYRKLLREILAAYEEVPKWYA